MTWAIKLLAMAVMCGPGMAQADAIADEIRDHEDEVTEAFDFDDEVLSDDALNQAFDDNEVSTSIAADQVLAAEAFEFCHADDYPLTEAEAQWCPLIDDVVRARCPAFASTCNAPRAQLQGDAGPGSTRRIEATPEASPRSRDTKDGGPDRQAHDEAEDASLELPTLGMPAHIGIWLVVAAMLAAVILRSARVPSAPTPAPTSPARSGPVADSPAGNLATNLPNETDVARLLARAEAKCNDGDFEGAIADAHGALLRGLAERGKIRLHPSRTNGDYVRDVASDVQLRPGTKDVVNIVERVQFGRAGATKDQVDRVLTRVRGLLGVVALCICCLSTGFACDSASPRTYPWADSPSGLRGVLMLLRGNGINVDFRSEVLEDLDAEGPIPIILADSDLSADEWDNVLTMVDAGGQAVIASGEQPLPAKVNVSYRSMAGQELTGAVEGVEFLTVKLPSEVGLDLHGQDATYVLIDRAGVPYAAYIDRGAGGILLLADGRLFENASLAVADNGAFLVELLPRMGGSFELIHGSLRANTDAGAEDPFEAMANLHLTPVLLQLLALLALLYVWRGAHFGRPQPTFPPSRRNFSEHVRALAHHYQRARAKRHALGLYAGWALERLRRKTGGTPSLSRLARRLAAHTERDETEVLRILVEAQDARDDQHDGHGHDDDLFTMRALAALLRTTRGTDEP